MSEPLDSPTSLRLLRDELDRNTSVLVRVHAERLRCRLGCHDCCVDDLTVFEIEAEAIREAFPELLAAGLPHPAGACAFLDAEGGCRIYSARPYVCRTQGLPLRWVSLDSGDALEYRDICPLNEPDGPELTELPADQCWTLGPWEGRLAGLQAEHGEPDRRVHLRALFDNATPR